MNIIADIAGRYDELLLLEEQMPADDFLYLGDLSDRGKDSRKVIEHVMNKPKSTCVKSNHGDMMVACYNMHNGTNYPCGNFYSAADFEADCNGMQPTAISYGGWKNIPKEHIEWLANLPWYYMDETMFVSHGPWHPELDLKDACNLRSFKNLLWNRTPPYPRSRLQIYGHNKWGQIFSYLDGKPYAICLDDSGRCNLTGLHTGTMKIYQQEYLTLD